MQAVLGEANAVLSAYTTRVASRVRLAAFDMIDGGLEEGEAQDGEAILGDNVTGRH